jgi:hypothetical protein
MKYLATLLLIMSFVGIGVFGFTLVDHVMMGSSNNDCVASAIDGTECPTNLMAMTSHHISAIQTLTTTLPASSNWLLLLASLLLIAVSIFLFYKNLLLPKLEFLPQRLRDLTLHSLYSKQRIVSWLSLFELSPSL